MPRCHLARTLCALCALLGSFAACGARTALDTSDYLPNVAGATSSNAGARAGGPSIDPEVCARFAPLWDSRAGATTLTCDTCLRDVGCGYYPNSKFVHIDVRPYGTDRVLWVDDSLPGTPSHYLDGYPGVLDPGIAWVPQ